jgi:hypothetical protein
MYVMSDNVSLVTDALEYYDMNNDKFGDNFKNVRYVKFEMAANDIDHNKITMYDKNKKQVYRSKYELIGLHNSDTKTWVWGWAIPSFKKNTTNIVRKIMNYGAELDPDSRFLKTELITSRFRISDPIQLDVHTAIASYLAKKPVIYKLYSYKDFILDEENYLDVTRSKDVKESNSYTIYYLYILDY